VIFAREIKIFGGYGPIGHLVSALQGRTRVYSVSHRAGLTQVSSAVLQDRVCERRWMAAEPELLNSALKVPRVGAGNDAETRLIAAPVWSWV